MRKPQIRKDYFRDDYVIIAPNRAKRPMEIKDPARNEPDICYFCPENFRDHQITYQDNGYAGEWEILSVINKYSALSLDNVSAYGQAEVVIETRKHGMDVNDFSVDHIVRLFDAYIERFMTLRNIDGIKHVIVFKNEGGKAGASMPHTHSQIIALPILPHKIESEARAFNKYRLEKQTCPYCDIVTLESHKKSRLIWQDDNVIAFAPYASDSPYGVWIFPKRHIRLVADLTRSEKESYAKALKIVLGTLDKYAIPYNYFIENAVNNEDYHMHMRIAPRPNIWAGLELGTGVIINPISPEFATKIYKSYIEYDLDKNHK
jgi:UDPglucose--hexose-1-phosphate uridylyltransferase